MWGRLENTKDVPLEDRGRYELNVLGRLQPRVSRQAAQLEATALGQNLERSYPETDAGRRIMVWTELQSIVAKEPSRLAMVAMLLGLSAIVLVIACVNVANIALTRAMARTREIAIRLSIGSGTMRLVRQLMTENLALALPGSLAGLAFGYGGILLLRRIRIPSDPPFVLDLRMDARLLTFNLIAAVLSCLLFGLAPALQSRRVQLVSALKSGGVDGASRTRGRMFSWSVKLRWRWYCCQRRLHFWEAFGRCSPPIRALGPIIWSRQLLTPRYCAIPAIKKGRFIAGLLRSFGRHQA